MWSIVKTRGGIAFLGDFLFILSLNRGESFTHKPQLTGLRGRRAATGEASSLSRKVIEGAGRTGLAILDVLCEAAAPVGPGGTGQRGRCQGRAVMATRTRLLVVALTAWRKRTPLKEPSKC